MTEGLLLAATKPARAVPRRDSGETVVMRRQLTGLILTLVLIVTAACTSSDDTDAATSATTSSPATCPDGTTLADGLCVVPGAQAQEAAQAVRKAFQDDALGSVIVGVWQDGNPLLLGALGESPPGVPASVDMHHITGNVSTAILTTALLQQVDAGKLALTDKLSKWYPDLPSADAVTVEMLARTTTGYSHYPSNEAFQQAFYADPFKAWTPDELIAYGVAGGPAFPPGTNFLFSDTNHATLSQVLAKATGRSVGELVQEGILDRLGMKDTTPPEPAALRAPVLHSYTGERDVWEEGTFWNPSWIGFVGGWGSNQDDIRKFIDAVGTGALLSKASHEAQLAPVTVGMGSNTPTRYRGMGLNVVNGWVFMSPGLQGLEAGVATLPDKLLTIVVYNTRTPKADPSKPHAAQLVEQLSAIFSPDKPVKL